jgi:hypothetical protein
MGDKYIDGYYDIERDVGVVKIVREDGVEASFDCPALVLDALINNLAAVREKMKDAAPMHPICKRKERATHLG